MPVAIDIADGESEAQPGPLRAGHLPRSRAAGQFGKVYDAVRGAVG